MGFAYRQQKPGVYAVPMTTPYTPAHDPIPMNMFTATSGDTVATTTTTAATAATSSSNQRPAFMNIANHATAPKSAEAKRRAEARVASMNRKPVASSSLRISAASSSRAVTTYGAPAFTAAERRAKAAAEATAAKAAGLAAKLARAESELRTALASRDTRSAEVEKLRRRAAAAEAAVTERDARLAEAHRRAAAALSSSPSPRDAAAVTTSRAGRTPPRHLGGEMSSTAAVTWADDQHNPPSGLPPGVGAASRRINAVDQLTSDLGRSTAAISRRGGGDISASASAADADNVASSSFSFHPTAGAAQQQQQTRESRAEVDQLARGLLKSSEKVLAAAEDGGNDNSY